MSNSCICFLDTRTFDGGDAIRGAALLTDHQTEPVEFRCTSDIRPTKLQKTLWGDRLIGHIATQLVGKPLLDALSTCPALVVVRKPEFIELRTLIEVPLVQVLRRDELSLISPLSLPGTDGEVRSGCEEDEPLTVKTHFQFTGDVDIARDVLVEVYRSVPLLEPFARIESALDIVHQQDSERSRS